MRLSRVSVALYVGLIFLSGVVVGAFGHQFYTVRAVDANTRPSPEEWRKRYIGEMHTRLGLEEAQLQELNRILDNTHARFKAVRESMRPEMDAIRQSQVEQIRGILTPAQQLEYQKMRDEREKNMNQREKSKNKVGSGPGF